MTLFAALTKNGITDSQLLSKKKQDKEAIKPKLERILNGQYHHFQKYIKTAYGRLRSVAPLILNLLSLIGQGPLQTIEDNVSFVYSRFSLQAADERGCGRQPAARRCRYVIPLRHTDRGKETST